MGTWMSNPTGRAYAEVVASTALEAGATGAWVMAGELSARNRRLVRTGLAATAIGIGIGISRLAPPEDFEEPEDEPEDDPEDGSLGNVSLALPEEDGRADDRPGPDASGEDRPGLHAVSPALGAAAAGIALVLMIGSAVLQKRWLAGLERAGHRHPHRALALRVAVLSFAGALPARLTEVERRSPGD